MSETFAELTSFLLILSIPTFFALVGLRRDKVRDDRKKRMQR